MSLGMLAVNWEVCDYLDEDVGSMNLLTCMNGRGPYQRATM